MQGCLTHLVAGLRVSGIQAIYSQHVDCSPCRVVAGALGFTGQPSAEPIGEAWIEFRMQRVPVSTS